MRIISNLRSFSKMDKNVKLMKCKLDKNGCVNLSDMLKSFNAPISEEHAWALCFQCAKCYKSVYKDDDNNQCRLVKRLEQVIIHKDGYVHTDTILNIHNNPGDEVSEKKEFKMPTEEKLLAGLGYVIFQALDFCIDDDEERAISPQLERLLNLMIQTDENKDNEGIHQETDDEGIEKDSCDCEDELRKRAKRKKNVSLDKVLEICASHVGAKESEEADTHYRAVCRAFVAEALELSSFLQKVSEGTNDLRQKADTIATSEALDSLNFSDWARLWMQVIRELRHGVKLKKVVYTGRPIEYELTPYEILMEDIRSRRYKLNKVTVNGSIPGPVKKDAHAIILEFIRSRPPLKKASERQLLPPRRMQATPRERLLQSIKDGDVKLRRSVSASPKKIVPYDNIKNITKDNNNFQRRQGSTRRLIKVDYSVIQSIDDDDYDDEVDKIKDDKKKLYKDNNDKLCGTSQSQQNAMCRTAYDLATLCPRRKSSTRRHTIVGSLPVDEKTIVGSAASSNNNNNIDVTLISPIEETLSTTLPEMSWSRTSLQEDLFESVITKQWQDECLSLTLEEVVHIRSVLTKAELEGLPVEGHVKEDVEKRKVCFLCLKTRFSIFGPWGQICKLCSRTVCSRCYSKMRIPTEHFSHIPVVALSPTMISPNESDYNINQSLMARLVLPDNNRASVGSAPTSPKISRASPLNNAMSASYHGSTGPKSLPSTSPAHSISEKRSGFNRYKTLGRSSKAEKLKGIEMIVCLDCKTMVLQIIRSSRISRSNMINSFTLDLSPVYS